MKRFLILISALALTFPVQARKNDTVARAYAYGHSLDIQTGLVGMPYSVSGDAGKAYGIGGGGQFRLRYSCFPGKHWGFFAAFSILGTDIEDVNYFRTANRADGERYRYGSTVSELYYAPSNNLYGNEKGFFGAAFEVGAAYRYDFGGWSLRPMLGVGIGSCPGNSYSYKRTPRDGGMPTAVSYHTTDKCLDYMDKPVSDNTGIAAVLSAAVQLTYTFNHHFYISLECGIKSFPNSRGYEKTVYEYKIVEKSSDTPSSSAAQPEPEYEYAVDFDSSVSSSALLPFNFFDISFGIGWNLGRNRHQSGKYSK